MRLALERFGYPQLMRLRSYSISPLLTLALVAGALAAAGCDSFDENVRLPSKSALQERFGSLALGTYEMREEGDTRSLRGDSISIGGFSKDVMLLDGENRYVLLLSSFSSTPVNELRSSGTVKIFSANYDGRAGRGLKCEEGRVDVLSTTAEGVRAVFALVCGFEDLFVPMHDRRLVQGGFYVRRD